MSKTMEQFKSLMTTVDELRNKQKLLIEDFEKSTCELSGVFHWIVPGVFYLVFNGLLTILFARAEKKLNYFRG